MKHAYKAKCGAVQYKPSAAAAIAAAEEGSSQGWCLGCGGWQCGCEPDMRKGKCESCGKSKVYGAEELLLMGLVH